MKLKLMISVLMGLCLTLVFAVTAFADSMIEKQSEIDHYLFEEKAAELKEIGITVTHTAPLENTVEIGITPFNEENVNYFYEAFGKENVTVVEGQQAVTFEVGSEETDVNVEQNSAMTAQEPAEKSNPLMIAVYFAAGALMIIGAVLAFRRKKQTA